MVASSAPQSGSSFRLPMLLLPRQKRQDLQTVYALCRALDDAVDDAPDTATALQNLAFWQTELEHVFSDGTPTHPIALAFQKAHKRLRFAPEHAYAMLAAMRMDAEGKMLYPSLDALEDYCYGAASCAGLLSMRVFGCEGEAADAFALHLGKALQLTNIGRDILPDAARGRVYLAAEWVSGNRPSPAALCTDTALLSAAYRQLAERAEHHYRQADLHAAQLPIRAIAPALAMRDVYRHYHLHLQARGHVPPATGKIAIGMGAKTRIAGRALGYLIGM